MLPEVYTYPYTYAYTPYGAHTHSDAAMYIVLSKVDLTWHSTNTLYLASHDNTSTSFDSQYL